MENKTQIVVGYRGEVGGALYNILQEYYDDVLGVDIDRQSRNFVFQDLPFILHICIPYSKDFLEDVKNYQKQYAPTYTIIHSTVPVGVSRKLNAMHSPIRGLHPNLEQGIRTFPKFLGGEQASLVADIFRRAGIDIILVDKSETTEAGKLFDTEYYRICIEFAKRVKTFCDKEKLNFHEVYTLFNLTYNEGYNKLGHGEFTRPVLQPIMTPIGGHCVMQNKELING